MLLCVHTKNALGQQDAVDNDTSVKKEREKEKKKVVAEKNRINMLTYRHLLIKYHLVTWPCS